MIAHSYDDLSLGDYYKITDLKDDVDVLSFFFEIPVDGINSLKISDVTRMTERLSFLLVKPPLSTVSVDITTENWLDYSSDNSKESIAEMLLGSDWYSVNCIEGLSKIESFVKSLSDIIASYSSVFGTSTSKSSDSFSESYGTLHLILQVCEKTNETFTTVLSWPLVKTLNIVSYLIAYSEKLEKQYSKSSN